MKLRECPHRRGPMAPREDKLTATWTSRRDAQTRVCERKTADRSGAHRTVPRRPQLIGHGKYANESPYERVRRHCQKRPHMTGTNVRRPGKAIHYEARQTPTTIAPVADVGGQRQCLLSERIPQSLASTRQLHCIFSRVVRWQKQKIDSAVTVHTAPPGGGQTCHLDTDVA